MSYFKTVDSEYFRIAFEKVYIGELSKEDASKFLGVCRPTFLKWYRKTKENGGIDRNLDFLTFKY